MGEVPSLRGILLSKWLLDGGSAVVPATPLRICPTKPTIELEH